MAKPKFQHRAVRSPGPGTRPVSSIRMLVVLVALLAIAGCSDDPPAPAPTPEAAKQAPAMAPKTANQSSLATPNVIVITLDTTRADALGAYGQKRPTTPNIDKLAEQGAQFLVCTTSAPSTLPSHSSIFTGKYPLSHGARSNSGHVLSEANQTLAEVLKSHGYATAAEVAAPVIGSHTQLDQGFDLYRDLKFSDITRKDVIYQKEDEQIPVNLHERDAADITKHAIRFIQQQRDEKFFLWLHYFDPHQPYSPPLHYFEQVGESDYHGEVRYVDDQIARVLGTLDQLALTDRTLIVITGDHGEGRGEHFEKTHVFFVYNSTMHVPLIMSGAKVPAGLQIEAPVRTIDIAPTILDLLDLPPLEIAQGVSLRPLLTGEAHDLNLVSYGASIDPYTVFGTPIVRFLRVGKWKYIHKVNPELYDVVSDPHELTNRAAEETEVVEQMQAALRELVEASPPSPSDSQQPIDAAAAAQLEALGYIVAASSEKLGDELSLLELSGGDLNDKIEDITLLAQGTGRLKANDFAGAVGKLRPVVEHNPDRVPTMLRLIEAFKGLEDVDEQRLWLGRAIAIDPGLVNPYVSLAEIEFKAGNAAEAERLLGLALENDACAVSARATLAHLAEQRKDHRRHIALLRDGVEGCKPSDALLNNYAYALATSPDGEVRDGAEALQIALQITRDPKGNRPDFLDTLAAAYAETGDFGNAVAAGKRALALLRSAGAPPPAIAEATDHLALFESNRAVRAN